MKLSASRAAPATGDQTIRTRARRSPTSSSTSPVAARASITVEAVSELGCRKAARSPRSIEQPPRDDRHRRG